MARSPYGGQKRGREIAKKKKREEKLARKQNRAANGGSQTSDTAYLEYLHPGGVPEELLPDSEKTDAEGEQEETRDE